MQAMHGAIACGISRFDPCGAPAAVRHMDVPYAENAGAIFGPNRWRDLYSAH